MMRNLMRATRRNVFLQKQSCFLLILLFLAACGEVQNEQQSEIMGTASYQTDTLEIRYAKNFMILRHADHIEIQVFNPYPSSTDTLKYLLSRNSESSPSGAFVVPIQRAVVFSAPHFGLLERLNQTNSIVAISNQSYFATETEFEQIGELAQSSREVLFSLRPDVVFLTAISKDAYQKWSADGTISLPIVHCSEWLERTPLGRAEWIKVFGAFYGKLDEAERLFSEIESRYLATQKKVLHQTPVTCFTGSPFKGIWYMAQGSSYITNLLEDAGGQHLWADEEGTGSLPLDFEVVFDRAKDGDFWVNANFTSLENLQAQNVNYAAFRSFAKENILINTKWQIGGVNAYWTYGIAEPDVLLKDLATFFHPDPFPDYEPVYYQRLH